MSVFFIFEKSIAPSTLGVGNAVNSPSPVMTASACSNASSQIWKTRLTNIKNSFLGSPRFHRRKLQGKSHHILQ